jgi:hypothetical protein
MESLNPGKKANFTAEHAENSFSAVKNSSHAGIDSGGRTAFKVMASVGQGMVQTPHPTHFSGLMQAFGSSPSI